MDYLLLYFSFALLFCPSLFLLPTFSCLEQIAPKEEQHQAWQCPVVSNMTQLSSSRYCELSQLQCQEQILGHTLRMPAVLEAVPDLDAMQSEVVATS